MERLVLDYTDYVEMACSEEDGVYSSYPSVADVKKSAYRFIDPDFKPVDYLAVSYEHHQRIIDRYREYDASRRLIFGRWYHYNECPCCNTPLKFTLERPSETDSHIKDISVRVCLNCGWWDFEENFVVDNDVSSGSYLARSVHRRAVLREYSVAGSEAPIASLQKHIINHPSSLFEISPKKLEQLVGAVFAEYMDCEAIHIGGPNDNGIDLILVNGNRRYVVQVKHRKWSRKTEPVAGIREFLGAMVLDGTMKGLFVTTASHFSRSAANTAKKAQENGIVEYISLVNAQRLVDVCNIVNSLIVPLWATKMTKTQELLDHVQPGYDAFMTLAIGNPDWRVSFK